MKADKGCADGFPCAPSTCPPGCSLSPDRQVISCSEDGSVRIWELREKQQLSVEPAPTGVYLLSKRWSCFFSHVKDRRKAVMCNHRNNIQCAPNKHVYMKHLGIRMGDSHVNIYCRTACLFQVS